MDYLKAIKNTHTNAVSISEIDGVYLALDKDGNSVTIDQSLVDIEAVIIQSAYDAKQYARDRNYAPTGDQLDMLWHSIDAGEFGDTAKQSEFYTANKAVKDANPKG